MPKACLGSDELTEKIVALFYSDKQFDAAEGVTTRAKGQEFRVCESRPFLDQIHHSKGGGGHLCAKEGGGLVVRVGLELRMGVDGECCVDGREQTRQRRISPKWGPARDRPTTGLFTCQRELHPGSARYLEPIGQHR